MKWLVMPVVLALSVPVVSQADSKKVAKYDPSTVVTVKGTVLGEQRVAHGKGPKAVRIVVKTDDGQVSVQVGPDTYVDAQKLKVQKGDEVTVKGSKITWEGSYGVIAQSISRGGETLVLRDAAGKPAWNKTPKS